jgi:hypothetical protein
MSQLVETYGRAGFGRGSAVREYWLTRCEGFRAIGADGRPLGHVRRLEPQRDGTLLLRLSGPRSRAIPLDAIEKVWPASSLLLLVEADAQAAGEGGARHPALNQELARSAAAISRHAKAARVALAAELRTVPSRLATLRASSAKGFARARVRMGRLLVRLAIAVAGSRAPLQEVLGKRDSRAAQSRTERPSSAER